MLPEFCNAYFAFAAELSYLRLLRLLTMKQLNLAISALILLFPRIFYYVFMIVIINYKSYSNIFEC